MTEGIAALRGERKQPLFDAPVGEVVRELHEIEPLALERLLHLVVAALTRHAAPPHVVESGRRRLEADNVVVATGIDEDAHFAWRRDWQRRLADGGWASVHWPVEYGGNAASTLFVSHVTQSEYQLKQGTLAVSARGNSRWMNFWSVDAVSIASPRTWCTS